MYLKNKKREKNTSIRLKNKIKKLFKNFKFKSFNLSFSKQLTIIGSIIGFISLFLPWIKDTEKFQSWNSFYPLTGNIGFLLIIILIIPIIGIISTNYKEKIKLYSDLSLKNHFMIITSGFFVISFSIITLGFVNGLQTFFENISYGNGVILCITSGFIILIGGIIIRKEYYLNNSKIILNKLDINRGRNKEKNNMKLPF